MFDYKKFKNVFSGISMRDGEEKAKMMCDYYSERWADLTAGLPELNENQEKAVKAFLEIKKPTYKRRVEKFLSSFSNIMSTLITGRSKFPAKRNQKHLESNRKKEEEIENSLEFYKKSIKKIIENNKTQKERDDKFLNEIKKYAGNEDFLRALLKGKLERQARKKDISFVLDYLEEHLDSFKITKKAIDKIRLIKPLSVLDISKEEYFENRGLVKSLKFRWDKVDMKWVGTEQAIKKYNKLKKKEE